jgi:hypothetical protein
MRTQQDGGLLQASKVFRVEVISAARVLTEICLFTLSPKFCFFVSFLSPVYVAYGVGIESRWGTRFSAPVQTDRGAHSASYTMGMGYFQWVKRPGVGLTNHPHLALMLKEE